MARKSQTQFHLKYRSLIVTASVLSVLAVGLTAMNTYNNRDLALAQNDPNNPGGGTVILPGNPTTSGSSTSGQTSTSTGSTSTGTSTGSTSTGTSTSTTSSPTTPNTNTSAPSTPTPSSPVIESESIVDGTGQTISTPSGSTSTQGGTTTPVPYNADNTVRSGGLEITLAGFAVVLLAAAYYYYKKHGDTKSVLKMAEKKITPSKK